QKNAFDLDCIGTNHDVYSLSRLGGYGNIVANGNDNLEDDDEIESDCSSSPKMTTFNETIEIIPTYRKSEYNRRSDKNATFKILNPDMKVEIKNELNNFKMKEMAVHIESMGNTSFHH
ncbi:hypothetical protein BGZ65_005238, partial [Modicella reniformis]